jgi:hypothetical protein
MASLTGDQPRGRHQLAATAMWIRSMAFLGAFSVALMCWPSISTALAGAPDAAPSSSATRSAVVGTRMQTNQVKVPHPIAHTRNEAAFSLDRLPRVSLPNGFFYDWCGADSFLVEDGKQMILYGADLKRGTVVPIVRDHLQCDGSASRIAWRDDKTNSIKVLNVKDGRVDTLATMRNTSFPAAIYALSPDFSALAYDPDTVELQLPEGGGPKLIPVTVGEGANQVAIHWSSDSSRLFHVVKSDLGAPNGESAYSETLEVVDTAGNRVRGKLPRGLSFANEGIFIRESEDLLLYMRPRDNDYAPGTVFRCTSKAIRCEQRLTRADEASLSERGLIGAVKGPPGPKKGRQKSRRPVPAKYMLELVAVDGTVQYAQQYVDNEELSDLVFKVAPSGRRAIVYRFSRSKLCDRGIGAGPCRIGEVIDLEGGRNGVNR